MWYGLKLATTVQVGQKNEFENSGPEPVDSSEAIVARTLDSNLATPSTKPPLSSGFVPNGCYIAIFSHSFAAAGVEVSTM